jgi:hypothetical protein
MQMLSRTWERDHSGVKDRELRESVFGLGFAFSKLACSELCSRTGGGGFRKCLSLFYHLWIFIFFGFVGGRLLGTFLSKFWSSRIVSLGSLPLLHLSSLLDVRSACLATAQPHEKRQSSSGTPSPTARSRR